MENARFPFYLKIKSHAYIRYYVSGFHKAYWAVICQKNYGATLLKYQ